MFKESFAKKKDHSCNRSHKFCVNFKETSQVGFTRGIKCYSSRGINNNYNNSYANASFQAILGSSVFDLPPLKHEQETYKNQAIEFT